MRALVASANPVGSSGMTTIGSPSTTTRNRNGVRRSIWHLLEGPGASRFAPAQIRMRPRSIWMWIGRPRDGSP